VFQTNPRGVEAEYSGSADYDDVRFRRTLVGLKQHAHDEGIDLETGFRRTLVGLKRTLGGRLRWTTSVSDEPSWG